MRLIWHGKPQIPNLEQAQKFVDSEVLRRCDPYIPMDTGELKRSGSRETKVGSGRVIWRTPYARYLYYGKVYGPNIPITKGGQVVGFFSPPGVRKQPTGKDLTYSKDKNPKAGSHWFERMKKNGGKTAILRGVAKITGGKVKVK